MTSRPPSHRRYRFPPEIISHAVWLYHRFGLIFRNVEDLLAQRGITVTYEAIRQRYLWRAVDEDGDVIDILVQSRRDRRTATRLFRKLLKEQGHEPRRLITAKLRSYSAAHRTVMPSVTHSTRPVRRQIDVDQVSP